MAVIPKKRFGLLLAALVILALMSGCGSEVRVVTTINPDLSGSQVLLIRVPASSLSEITGGEAALTRILRESVPAGGSVENVVAQGGSVEYKITYLFGNPGQLKDISGEILGRQPEISLSVSGTPFYKEYVFQDKVDPRDYFGWAVSAIKGSKLLPEGEWALIASAHSHVRIVGPYWDARHVHRGEIIGMSKIVPIERFSLTTDISDYSRTATIELTAAGNSLANIGSQSTSAVAIEYLQKIAPLGQVVATETPEGNVIYEIKIDGGTADGLAEKSAGFIAGEALAVEKVGGSVFFPVFEIRNTGKVAWKHNDRYLPVDLGEFAAEMLLPGKRVAADGRPILDGEGNPVRKLSVKHPSPEFAFLARYQQTSVAFFVVMGLVTATVLGLGGWGFVAFRRNPERFMRIFKAKISAKAAGAYCHQCGNLITRLERYCHKCGGDSQSTTEKGGVS